MRNLTKPVIAAAASVLAAVAMTACTSTPTPASPMPTGPATAPAAPGDPGTAPTAVGSTSAPFGGKVNNDIITANQMQVEVPKGFKLPENALVTKVESNNVMMADPDDAATKAMVESSAAAAGYTVYAEIAAGKVYVGQGNAVLFSSGPGVQMLTWGPEIMKDALAGKA